LANIKRKNIDETELMELALEAREIGANCYTEIILGLPGDTLEAHFSTLKKVVEADFNNISLYQLMLLPGTDLASEASKDKWKIETRYRALPRCYGYFDCLGMEINAAEIEEIAVSNSSLSFEDYLNCRRLHLIVSVFYNDGIYREVLILLKKLGLSVYDWLEKLYHYGDDNTFNDFVGQFVEETKAELWGDREQAEKSIKNRETLKDYISGKVGSNLIFKYRASALVSHADELAKAATTVTETYLRENGQSQHQTLANELIRFCTLRFSNIFENAHLPLRDRFTYPVHIFSEQGQKLSVDEFNSVSPMELGFYPDERPAGNREKIQKTIWNRLQRIQPDAGKGIHA